MPSHFAGREILPSRRLDRLHNIHADAVWHLGYKRYDYPRGDCWQRQKVRRCAENDGGQWKPDRDRQGPIRPLQGMPLERARQHQFNSHCGTIFDSVAGAYRLREHG